MPQIVQGPKHFFIDLAEHYAYVNIGVLGSRLVRIRVTAP